MLKKAIALWKQERKHKGTTLHRRLLIFFISVSVVLILLFTLLLSIFGIDGKQEHSVQAQLTTQLSMLADSVEDDFGRISLDGIGIAEDLAARSDRFFSDNGISADGLQEHPELIEPLLDQYMLTLVNSVKTRYCGGVFVMLDASVRQDSETAKAGIFLKKTQPTATENVGVDIHCLRGPAQLARDNGIMLLGQWKMEYDISDQPFWNEVMQTARDNPDLPLSRLYYWSGRVVLKGNSEAGFLLCVPMISKDGTVFGVCGIEVSDRMFKLLYTPESDYFDEIFTVAAPVCEGGICTSKGLLAGNRFLSGTRWDEDLKITNSHDGFVHYSGAADDYGGKAVSVRLYSYDSPYKDREWSVSLLMPQDILHNAVEGNRYIFITIVIGLLILAITASVIISRRYIKPVNEAFEQIRSKGYHESSATTRIPEIADLFAFLAQQDREHEDQMQTQRERTETLQSEVERLHGEKTALQSQVEMVKTDNTRLAYLRKDEVDPDSYALFLECMRSLSKRERAVFDLYVEGKTAKEIVEILGITYNGLKYHNKNIYSRLGVSSRKELLRYVAILKQEQGGNV